jgi:PPOX class probable F420-dependent enzyme
MTADPRFPDGAQRAFVAAARQAVLTTTGPSGRPRPVPVCFVLLDRQDSSGAARVTRLFTPLDEKPKRNEDPRALARVRDILARPAVSLLVARWDEDWSRLAWVRIDGLASLVEPPATRDGSEHAAAVAALRAKYPQYLRQAIERRPLIRIEIQRTVTWGSLD